MKVKWFKNLIIIVCVFKSGDLMAQYGFGTNQPDQRSIVHIVSQDSTKGFIVPIVKNGAIAADPSIKGMLIYNVDDSCVKMCTGSAWHCLIGDNSVGITDDQNIDSIRLNGKILTAYLEDGGSASLNIQPIIDSAYVDISNNLLNDNTWLNELRDSINTDQQNLSVGVGTASTSIINIERGDSVVLREGSNIQLTESGSQITISATGDGTGTDDQNLDSLRLSGTTLTAYLEDGGNASIDLQPIVDSAVANASSGSDNQTVDSLRLSGTTLTAYIENGGNASIDLQPIVDSAVVNAVDTDNQTIDVLSLTGTTLNISLEDDGVATQTLNLSSLQDGTGTDNQNLSVQAGTGTTSIIDIEDGDSVIISAGTGLSISEAGNTITLVNTVTDTDAQDLVVQAGTASNSIINITNGDSVVLVEGSNIQLTESGNSITISATGDGTGTDDQNISGSGLSGTNLTIGIENGTSQVVDLSPIGGDITAVTAGTGLTGGGTTGAVTINAVGDNGLTTNADDIDLGGALNQATTISQGANAMIFDMTGAGDFEVRDNGATTLFVRDDGNVGIGTASPSESLHVNGISLHEGLKVDINGNTQMYMYPNDGAGNWNQYWNSLGTATPTRTQAGVAYRQLLQSTSTSGTNGNLRWQYGGYDATAGTAITWSDALSIDRNNGYIGVGNNNASYPLDVTGTAHADAINVNGNYTLPTVDGTSGQVIRTNGSGTLTWYTPSSGDNLGNHTATTTLNLVGNNIENVGQITGGFGAATTAGTLDWNDVSNSKSGNGYTLLLGTATNGPSAAGGNYFHPFNFEYSSKNGTGNITQFGIPYSVGSSINAGLHMRGRYSGTWTNWVKIISENTAGNVGIGTYSPSSKLHVVGNTQTTNFQMTSGATVNYVLRSDASGNASWVNPNTLVTADITAVNAGTGLIGGGTSGDVTLGIETETYDNLTVRAPGVAGQGEGSGFYQTSSATTAEAWPTNTGSWYHLINSQHSNTGNNYAMQLASPFFSQELYYRSTNNNGSQAWSTVWTSSSDGAGSGLDADLLDGISSASFLRSDASDTYSGGTLTFNNIAGQDILTSGTIQGAQIFQPTANADALLTFHVGGDYAFYFGLDGNTNDLTVGGWSMGAGNKYRVWHEGNDGSGSGLDADLLDGLHASSFTPADDFRAYNFALTSGTTTATVISQMETNNLFDSKVAGLKTTWSYAGNTDLTDAGRLTELAGTSWLTWTDNSSDVTRGNITALVIAPNTGGSANKVFVYNDQGSTYSPGWRELWTDMSDGSGSGLDADLLDGLQASGFIQNQTAVAQGANFRISGKGTMGTFQMTTGATNNYVLRSDAAGNGSWVNVNTLVSGDNLGNHTATTTLNMNSQNQTNVNNISMTATPTYDKLRVWNSSSYTIGMNSAQSYGFLNDYAMTFTMSNTLNRGWLWRDVSDAANDGAMSLTTDGRLTVKSTAHFQGNVGVGTASPSYRLHVLGDVYANGGWLRTSGSAGWYNESYGGGWYMTDATWIRTYGSKNIYQNAGILRTDGDLQVGPGGTYASLPSGTTATVFNEGSFDKDFRIESDGSANMFFVDASTNRVGIGTAAPSQALHVNGRIRTNGINETSDRRYKKDIKDLSEDILDKVLQLRGVTYKWKQSEYPEMEFEDGTQIGVIAQEIETIFPEVVQTDENGYKSVDYSHLVPVLIEAIKEQQKEINRLKTLEKRIYRLENLMEQVNDSK